MMDKAKTVKTLHVVTGREYFYHYAATHWNETLEGAERAYEIYVSELRVVAAIAHREGYIAASDEMREQIRKLRVATTIKKTVQE